MKYRCVKCGEPCLGREDFCKACALAYYAAWSAEVAERLRLGEIK